MHTSYEKRAKIEAKLGDKKSAEEDFLHFKEMKKRTDIRRLHYVKHLAEVENTPFAYFYLACCYEQLKDYDNAIISIDKAISMTNLNNQYKRYKLELISKSKK
mgnify:CR=1 FL=1